MKTHPLPILTTVALLLVLLPATALSAVATPRHEAGATGAVAAVAAQAVAPPTTLRRAARVVTYKVETRGRLRADVGVFKRQARETYAHARGWRRADIRFRQVSGRARFSLVLAEASWLPKFSPACSREWSCRVGRYVVINQTRWLQSTPLWRREGGTRRSYRHLVINHETGHWLGLGHRSCPRRGAAAPVMQTQSKGLNGCRINAFPKQPEVRAAR